jgi:hypothetical protein
MPNRASRWFRQVCRRWWARTRARWLKSRSCRHSSQHPESRGTCRTATRRHRTRARSTKYLPSAATWRRCSDSSQTRSSQPLRRTRRGVVREAWAALGAATAAAVARRQQQCRRPATRLLEAPNRASRWFRPVCRRWQGHTRARWLKSRQSRHSSQHPESRGNDRSSTAHHRRHASNECP